jgi:hypothetical protein
MATEQVWEWYWSHNEEDYHGPCSSREEAIAEGRYECEAGESFYIAEACRGGLQNFIGDNLLEWIDDRHYEMSDPDGDPISANIQKAEWNDLQKRLDVASQEWAKANNINRHIWAFRAMRNQETIPAASDEVK